MATLPASLISSITHRTPLRFTPTSNSQPYLPLPHPTLKLALTLPRPEDLPLQLETLNHPQVWPWLQGPPYPYERNDAEWWNASEVTRWETWVAGWEEEEGGGWKRKEGKAGEGCPLGVLRVAREEIGEVLGEGIWVGDLGIRRWAFEDTPEEGGERARMVKENEARAVGDEDLLWTFGFFLHPTYHKQGIPTAALRALLTSYVLPPTPYGLGAKRIRSAAYVGNAASRRVQEKCGLRSMILPSEGAEGEGREKTFMQPVSESRGGGMKEVWCFEWCEGRDGPLEERFL